MKKKAILLFLIIGAFAVLVTSRPAYADNPDDIIVFVNKSVDVNKLNIDDVQNFFLKRKIQWQKGSKVFPFNAKSGTGLREEFLRRALGMTLKQEQSYWNSRKIQSGVSKPPEVRSMQKAVFRISGAIGYMYRADYKEGVTKVVLVLPSG